MSQLNWIFGQSIGKEFSDGRLMIEDQAYVVLFL